MLLIETVDKINTLSGTRFALYEINSAGGQDEIATCQSDSKNPSEKEYCPMINSLWMKSSELQKFSRLLENINTDVCVIGGGIAGLTTAYLLSKEGKKVCVLEDFELGHGQTGKTSAHFSYVLGTRYYELKEIHGFDKARLAAHAHLNALEKIESIVTEERASCDFKRVNGYLYLGKNDKKETLMKELEVLHSFGLREVHSLPKLPIGSFNSGPCLCFPKQIQMHPLKYIKHLIEKIKKNGGQIFTHTHVADIESGKPITVKTKDNFTVHADKVVVATNSPINNIFTIHTKQAPYRTYVIGFKVPKKSIANALYWDTEDPYHYVRLHEEADFDILIVGGEDHKTGQKEHPEICFSNLEGWVKEKFPMIQGALYKWSGQVMETVDGLAYLGKNPHDENIYIITGDCGNGLTHGTIGATLITDQICNRENEFEEVFSPSRKSFRSLSLKEYLRENANVALQYAEWLTAESYANVDRLEIGEGTVINQGLKKIAVYKNSKGELELKSATCTHLGCVVTWNTVEKTWDCPCHGSRYECDGKVIEGPATRDLKEESA